MIFAGNNMVYPTYDPSDHSLLITYYWANSWERVMLPAGIFTGTVSTYPPADLEEVEISVCNLTIHPDETGMFIRNVPVGIFDVSVALEGYETVTIEDVEFIEDQVTPLFFELYSVDASENVISTTGALHQNSPNPFNPETTINFNLTHRSKVEIGIYNSKGQRVKTLIDSQYETGNYCNNQYYEKY